MKRGLPNLPNEIIYDILSRLPVKPLCRFKSVSKPWLALITDPHFIKSIRDNSMNHKLIIYTPTSPSLYSMDYQAPDPTMAELERPCKSPVEILGSFNGIVLLENCDILCLWNPCIRTFQEFSPPECPDDATTMYGLCYDSVSDDFKVVRVSKPLTDGPCVVHVFSSKLSSWKRVGDFGYYMYNTWPRNVVNGAPHWVVISGIDFTPVIVCFDPTEEEFREVPQPNHEGEDDVVDLAVLGGLLCVVKNHRESPAVVWVMKEYGVKESWTKLFVVPNVLGEFHIYNIEPLCYTKDGEVVMVLYLKNSKKLVIYHPEQERYKWVEITQDSKWFYAAFYVDSLVSPRCCSGTRRHR